MISLLPLRTRLVDLQIGASRKVKALRLIISPLSYTLHFLIYSHHPTSFLNYQIIPPLPTDRILQSITLSHSQPPSPNLPPSPTLASLHSEPTMQPMSQLVGRAAMPAPRSKKALKMFDGDEDDIAEFLDVYKQCVEDAQLPDTDHVKVMF